jgi:hypothetical protein
MLINVIGFIMVFLGLIIFMITKSIGITGVFIFGGAALVCTSFVEMSFFDYVVVNKNEAMVRKRIYITLLPLTLISAILTLGKAPLKIPVFEKYYIVKAQENKTLIVVTNAFITGDEEVLASQENYEIVKLSFKEYFRLWREQTKLYKSGQVSKDIAESVCVDCDKTVRKEKIKLSLAIVFTLLSLTGITAGEVALALSYAVFFLPMVILWIPDLIKAKAKQKAYKAANKL